MTRAATTAAAATDAQTTPPHPLPVWLDCDPGHDDAMAIVLAGHSAPHLRLVGVSTVASNQSVDKTTRNALDTLDWAGLNSVDVYAGAAKPLLRDLKVCPEIHGESGLDGPHGGHALPRSARSAATDKKAVAAIAAAVDAEADSAPGGRLTLVCTGALTNAALLLCLYPEVIPRVELFLMGGALGLGNTGPVQEFNMQVDPEAAKIVFESGVPITMVPIEVTHQVLVTPRVRARILAGPNAAAAAGANGANGAGAAPDAKASLPSAAATSAFRATANELLSFFEATYKELFFFEHAPLHDPVAVAAAIAPAIFKFDSMRVDIECASELSAGQTVCDVWRQSARPVNCRVARGVDVDAFWELMLGAVDAADAAVAAAAAK